VHFLRAWKHISLVVASVTSDLVVKAYDDVTECCLETPALKCDFSEPHPKFFAQFCQRESSAGL
jgi:predicted metalloenzyme YecM